jgi:hypothetical protein
MVMSSAERWGISWLKLKVSSVVDIVSPPFALRLSNLTVVSSPPVDGPGGKSVGVGQLFRTRAINKKKPIVSICAGESILKIYMVFFLLISHNYITNL